MVIYAPTSSSSCAAVDFNMTPIRPWLSGHLPESRARRAGPTTPARRPTRSSTSPLPTGNWLHDLEHGGVVVLYRPDLRVDQVSALRTTHDEAPVSRHWRTTTMVIVPYSDMDHAVTAVAWDHIDEIDTVDAD
jgi:Protein of unknown function (DUF3105)